MLTLAHSRRFSVAAGILPAVEPGRPARRRKRSPTPTVLENFRTALIFHRSFRAAGRQPSTADGTSAATTPWPLLPESAANCAIVDWNCNNLVALRIHLLSVAATRCPLKAIAPGNRVARRMIPFKGMRTFTSSSRTFDNYGRKVA